MARTQYSLADYQQDKKLADGIHEVLELGIHEQREFLKTHIKPSSPSRPSRGYAYVRAGPGKTIDSFVSADDSPEKQVYAILASRMAAAEKRIENHLPEIREAAYVPAQIATIDQIVFAYDFAVGERDSEKQKTYAHAADDASQRLRKNREKMHQARIKHGLAVDRLTDIAAKYAQRPQLV